MLTVALTPAHAAARSKFDAVVARLVQKIRASKTPVRGFILGGSGTDSLVAAAALATACEVIAGDPRGIPMPTVQVVNYVQRRPSDSTLVPGTFHRHATRWFYQNFPAVLNFSLAEPLGGNYEQQRWADLHLRSLNHIHWRPTPGVWAVEPRSPEEYLWVAGTMTATEAELGTRSMLANTVSIQPIRSLWKTEIMLICEVLGVPAPLLESARLPDCLCGRDELAAANLELVDRVLRHQLTPEDLALPQLPQVMAWVADTKAANSFKQRVPYNV